MKHAIATAIAAVLLISACGGSAGGPSKVTLTLADFTIQASPASVPAGQTTFTAKNAGKIDHEFALIKTDLAHDKLPLRTNDPTKVQENVNVGEIEDIKPGASKDLTLDLKPGKYVLICNTEGHYASGMHIAFEVK